MIKFFRQIRQNLLTENKSASPSGGPNLPTGGPASPKGGFSKYLIYATGEIILVVIGILIALQINNWNEKIQSERSISSHLEILKQNLMEDQIQLQSLKENITSRKQSADSAMMQMMTIRPVDNLLKKYLIMLYQEFKFSPNTNAIETINQSNEIPVLNNELRTAILDYYALIERTKEREDISNTQIQTKYESYVNNEYPNIFQKNNEWEFIASFYKNDPRPLSLVDKDKFLKDKILEALLVSRYYQYIALENFYGDLIKSSDKIVSIINEKEK